MISLKLKVEQLPEEVVPHLREYNKLSRCVYNLMTKKNIDHKEAVKWIEQKYSYNTEIINKTMLMDHIGIKADMMVKANKALGRDSVIFGSKHEWKRLHKNLLSKEDFDKKRNLSGCLYTGKAQMKGNMMCLLDTQNKQLIFKPKKGICIPIKYKTSKKRQKELEKIQSLGEAKLIPYSIEISHDYISVIVNESKISDYKPDYVKNRVAAFDANPNLNGFSIVQYNGKYDSENYIVYKEVSNLYELKKTHNSNKIKYELNCEAKRLAKLMRHYKVEVFGYEDLSMSGDAKLGKRFNRSCNNDWKRQHFLTALLKWCNIYCIKTQKVKAHYSSTIGCLLHPNETDSIAASLELNRRCYVYYNKFINKNKDFANVDVIYPPIQREQIRKRWNSILSDFKGKLGWVSLHKHIKQSKPTSLRFLYKDFNFEDWISFRPSSDKSLVMIHSMSG